MTIGGEMRREEISSKDNSNKSPSAHGILRRELLKTGGRNGKGEVYI